MLDGGRVEVNGGNGFRSATYRRRIRRTPGGWAAVEIEHIADITSRFIVNRAALKTRPEQVGHWIDRFREVALGVPRAA